MAELIDLGKHCNFENCNQLDFLPVKCNHCKNTFCKDHFNYLDHNCSSWKNLSENNPNLSSNVQKFHCKFYDCNRLEETPIVCPKCDNNFCMVHRLEKDHQCGFKAPQHMPKTADLVTQIIEKHQQDKDRDCDKTKKPKSLSAKAQKTAAKVQLMKLKQTAVGQKSIPMNDRTYFRVHFPLSKAASIKGSEKTKGVFVSKAWSFGKVLDILADLCGVENKNNVGGEKAKKLRLFKHSSGEQLTIDDYNAILDDLLKNEKVLNGESLVLEYLETDTLNNSETQLDVSKYRI